MCKLNRFVFSLSLLVFLFLSACSAGLQSQPTRATTYADPFAYCAAVGTVDSPDARYTGPKIPDSIIEGMVTKGIVSADAPTDFKKNAVWRCQDAHVWVCHFGANLPCLEKADTSQTPTSAMADYCKANPGTDNIPAAVTGRATVYEWKCNADQPAVKQQIFHADPQGFLTEFWYELLPK